MSWGIPQLCGVNRTFYGGIPDVYTRVTEYLEWIDENRQKITFVPAALGASAKLDCLSGEDENFTVCQLTGPNGGNHLNLFSRKGRGVKFQGTF